MVMVMMESLESLYITMDHILPANQHKTETKHALLDVGRKAPQQVGRLPLHLLAHVGVASELPEHLHDPRARHLASPVVPAK